MQINSYYIVTFTKLANIHFSLISSSFIVSLLIFFCMSLGMAPYAHAKKQTENKIKVKVLQNKEQDECMFMDEVVIRVKYRLKTADHGLLTAELTEDGANFYEVTSVDIERGRGQIIMTFDAGGCATNMRVIVK